jgi:hypothetical protein
MVLGMVGVPLSYKQRQKKQRQKHWEKGSSGCGATNFFGVLRLRCSQSARAASLRMTAKTNNSKSEKQIPTGGQTKNEK